ncbi:MAG: HDOD domain-containing protein [Opitutales bacterium]
MKLAVLDENGSITAAFKKLATSQSTYEVEVHTQKEPFTESLKRQPAWVMAVETDCVERTAKILGDLGMVWPRSIRIAFSNAFGVSRLRDLCGPANQFCFKPLDADAVKNRVQDAVEMIPLLTDSHIVSVVSGLQTLPTFSESYSLLLQELESADPDIDKIGSAIEQDVGLFATILSLANSSFFGRSTQVTLPLEAVSTLGFGAIQSVVLAAPALSLLDGNQVKGISREKFWAHSQKCAEIARRIAKEEGLKAKAINDCYSAALLHDVGQLVLASNYGERYEAYIARSKETGEKLHELEYSQMQTDHASIGACMLAMWGVKPEIVSAIWKHHTDPPGGADIDPTLLVYAADWISYQLDAENEDAVPEVASPVLQKQMQRWLRMCFDAEREAAMSA